MKTPLINFSRFFIGILFFLLNPTLVFSQAPEYTVEEAAAWLDALFWLNTEFVTTGRENLRELGQKFQIPVMFFHGRFDLTPPIENVQAYHD
ncbi:hypothetical protein [Cyclobacterium salsum]|uniref:hypothetical protein n=1 Tax=Cyclobacterium salsum TaxID=2666329 RepID=UPI001391CEC9|nr:hypothetical protein [Cyclobacterium salsum]